MLQHAEATMGDTAVEFGWTPCFKIGKTTWNVSPKDVKVRNDQHFVKVPRSAGCHAFRALVVAASDGAINADCDLNKSNGYSQLLQLRDEAFAEVERAAELAKLPSWQAEHVPKAKAQRKSKRKRIESVEDSCVLDLELKLAALDAPVTIKALNDSEGGELLWVEMTPQSMLYLCQYILEQGFADDRLSRSYVRRGAPKGVTVLAPKGKKRERYLVKLSNSAIAEAVAVDSSRRPRKSVLVYTLEAAQAVLNDPIAFVFPSATDDVYGGPDNDDADDDADGHDEHAAGEVNAAGVNADD